MALAAQPEAKAAEIVDPEVEFSREMKLNIQACIIRYFRLFLTFDQIKNIAFGKIDMDDPEHTYREIYDNKLMWIDTARHMFFAITEEIPFYIES